MAMAVNETVVFEWASANLNFGGRGLPDFIADKKRSELLDEFDGLLRFAHVLHEA